VRNRGEKVGYAVEAPNDKHQITNKFQWSKFQTEENCFGHLGLKFGITLKITLKNLLAPDRGRGRR
jgi:hypothetical protein